MCVPVFTVLISFIKEPVRAREARYADFNVCSCCWIWSIFSSRTLLINVSEPRGIPSARIPESGGLIVSPKSNKCACVVS